MQANTSINLPLTTQPYLPFDVVNLIAGYCGSTDPESTHYATVFECHKLRLYRIFNEFNSSEAAQKHITDLQTGLTKKFKQIFIQYRPYPLQKLLEIEADEALICGVASLCREAIFRAGFQENSTVERASPFELACRQGNIIVMEHFLRLTKELKERQANMQFGLTIIPTRLSAHCLLANGATITVDTLMSVIEADNAGLLLYYLNLTETKIDSNAIHRACKNDTLLGHAIYLAKPKCVNTLIACFARILINGKTQNDLTLAFLQMDRMLFRKELSLSCLDMMQCLIENGANINASQPDYPSLIEDALTFLNLTLLEFCLKNKAIPSKGYFSYAVNNNYSHDRLQPTLELLIKYIPKAIFELNSILLNFPRIYSLRLSLFTVAMESHPTERLAILSYALRFATYFDDDLKQLMLMIPELDEETLCPLCMTDEQMVPFLSLLTKFRVSENIEQTIIETLKELKKARVERQLNGQWEKAFDDGKISIDLG